jgi:hypothetical protein
MEAVGIKPAYELARARCTPELSNREEPYSRFDY